MTKINMEKNLLLEQEIKDIILPANNVANVQLGNSLEHALLVLTKTGYSAIPVLDHHSQIHGLISATLILDSILGKSEIEFEKLADKKVEDVMSTKVPRLKENDCFFRAMELSINNPFICIENQEKTFVGILTRKSILALLYRHFRNL